MQHTRLFQNPGRLIATRPHSRTLPRASDCAVRPEGPDCCADPGAGNTTASISAPNRPLVKCIRLLVVMGSLSPFAARCVTTPYPAQTNGPFIRLSRAGPFVAGDAAFRCQAIGPTGQRTDRKAVPI